MNSINLIPDSLDKPKSDLLIDSRLVADSSLPIQEQIFAITSVSSM